MNSHRLLPLNALASGQLPSRLKLFNWGRNDTASGPVVLNDVTSREFAANQRRTGRVRVAIDFEHNTVPETLEYARSKEPRPVAGYGTPLLIPGAGLYLDEISTTPAGESNFQNYEDLSPTPWLAPGGTLMGLHSAALCRAGAVYSLTLAGAALASFSAGGHPAAAGIQARKVAADLTYAEACVLGLKMGEDRVQRVKQLQHSRGWGYQQALDYLCQQERLAQSQAGQR